jgi:hypothetical protein
MGYLKRPLPTIRAATARHDLEALHLVANLLVENDVGQVNDALRAGVGVRVLFGWGRAEYARLCGGHEALLRGPRLREIRPSAEASYVYQQLYSLTAEDL